MPDSNGAGETNSRCVTTSQLQTNTLGSNGHKTQRPIVGSPSNIRFTWGHLGPLVGDHLVHFRSVLSPMRPCFPCAGSPLGYFGGGQALFLQGLTFEWFLQRGS